MAQRNAGAVDVENVATRIVVGPAPALQHGEHLRREGFVEFDEVDVAPLHAGAGEKTLHRRHRADAHARGIAARRSPADEIAHRLEAEFFELVFGDHEAGGRRIVLLAGVARRHHAALLDRAQRAQRLHRGVGAIAFVMREDLRIALALRHGDRHEFVGEAVFLPGLRRALVALHCVGVAGLAADLVVAREILRRLDHAGDDAEARDRLAHHAPAGEAVVHGDRARTRTVAHVGRIIFDIAHALDAACDDDIGRARLHHHGGVDHGLQAGPAAAVELVAGHRDRQVGRKRRPTRDAGRLAVAVALRIDDVVDLFGIDLGALDQFLQHDGAEVAGLDGRQRALEFADRSADRRDNGGAAEAVLGHGVSLPIWCASNATPPPCGEGQGRGSRNPATLAQSQDPNLAGLRDPPP